MQSSLRSWSCVLLLALCAAVCLAEQPPPSANLWKRNADGSISPKNGKSISVETPAGVYVDGVAIGAGGSSLPAGCTDSGANGITCTGAITALSFVSSYTGTTESIFKEGTIPSSPAANTFTLWLNSATHVPELLNSAGASTPFVLKIASGTAVLGTGALAANTCAAAVTVAATGVATTDVISITPNADISAATGYGAASTDGLIIYPYPTTGNVNFKVCNATGASITPGAVTLNFRVSR